MEDQTHDAQLIISTKEIHNLQQMFIRIMQIKRRISGTRCGPVRTW